MSFLYVELWSAVRRAARTRDACLLAVVIVAVLVFTPHLCAAQSVRGRVLDRLTDQPVAAVTVQLLRGGSGDAVAARSAADEQGHFRIEAPAPGRYRLRVTRIGYQPVVTPPFDLERLEDPLDVMVHISAVAVTLAPLTIVSDRPARLRDLPLEMVGYFDRFERWGREGLGMGHFLDREEIRSHSPYRVSDVVRMVPGVFVAGAGGLNQVILLRSVSGLTGFRCNPVVFINGAPVATGRDIDGLLSPWSLTAVEVYPGINRPGEFMSMGDEPCGAIALWTVGGNDEIADRLRHRRERATASQLELELVLSKESVTFSDAVHATLTLANLADTVRTLCITGSRFMFRGPGAFEEIVAQPEHGSSCVRVFELGSRASLSWHEIFYVPGTRRLIGEVLAQMHMTVQGSLCAGEETCQVELLSVPLPITVSLGGGSQGGGGRYSHTR